MGRKRSECQCAPLNQLRLASDECDNRIGEMNIPFPPMGIQTELVALHVIHKCLSNSLLVARVGKRSLKEPLDSHYLLIEQCLDVAQPNRCKQVVQFGKQ